MTRLIYHSAPRWRETEVVIRDRRVRPLVVASQPSALMLRLKGTRGTLSLPYSLAYQLAARLEADRISGKEGGEEKERMNPMSNLMKQRQLNERLRLFENEKHPGQDRGMDRLERELSEAMINEDQDRLLVSSKPDSFEML